MDAVPVFRPQDGRTGTAPLLSVRGVTLRYRSGSRRVTAVEKADFEVSEGDRLVLLGPSGCGKSTILKAVGGYIRPAEGRILLRDREVSKPGPDRVMVFQEFDQLLPWKTVLENVAFGLLSAVKELSRREALERARHYVGKAGLGKFADAYPHTLSGGMKQRTAIARCLAMKPDIVLMDEPFAALDALTRRKMQEDLMELWEECRFTLLFVTHSIAEALKVGTRVLLLAPHPGRVKAEIPVTPETRGEAGRPRSTEMHDRIQKILFDEVIDYAI